MDEQSKLDFIRAWINFKQENINAFLYTREQLNQNNVDIGTNAGYFAIFFGFVSAILLLLRLKRESSISTIEGFQILAGLGLALSSVFLIVSKFITVSDTNVISELLK